MSQYNTAHVVFQPARMSADDLMQGYLWMYKRVYSLKNILRRMPQAKQQILPYLMFNLFYRKFGRFTELLCNLISYKTLGRVGEKLSRYL